MLCHPAIFYKNLTARIVCFFLDHGTFYNGPSLRDFPFEFLYKIDLVEIKETFLH